MKNKVSQPHGESERDHRHREIVRVLQNQPPYLDPENYLTLERLKKQEYQKIRSNNYFWRTYDQKEIDWVEERDGRLFGYEFKWNAIAKPPKLWLDTYPEASFESINQSNYLSFIT